MHRNLRVAAKAGLIGVAAVLGAACQSPEPEANGPSRITAEDQGSNWRFLANDGGILVALDVNSFEGPATRRTFRTAMMSASEEPSIWYMRMVSAFDCEAETATHLSAEWIQEDGTVLDSTTYSDMPSVPARTAPSGEMAFGAACEDRQLEGQVFGGIGNFIAWVKEQRRQGGEAR